LTTELSLTITKGHGGGGTELLKIIVVSAWNRNENALIIIL